MIFRVRLKLSCVMEWIRYLVAKVPQARSKMSKGRAPLPDQIPDFKSFPYEEVTIKPRELRQMRGPKL